MMKKKILLVNTNTEKAPYPVPPVGICMIASAMEQIHDVKVYDGVFDEGRSIKEVIKDFCPDYIGFSIRNIDDVVAGRSVFYPEIILENFIKPAREVSGAKIILGGSGFNMFPEELMSSTGADYGVTGDGETGLAELLVLLERKNIPVGYIHKPSAVYTNFGYAGIDNHIDFNPYRLKGVYSVQTKRGCAHKCIYCSYPVIEGSNFRIRKPADIADEIEQASDRLGNVVFEFVDSTFNDPAGHAESVCREIIRRNLKVRMRTMGINPRHCSEELFLLMKGAGFVQIDATPDTASPEMLRNMRKGFSRTDIEKMAELIIKTDMPAMWFFLFGGPGENEKTFAETADFIENFVSPSDLVYLNYGLRIYPGTPLQEIAVREGKISADNPLFFPPVFYFPEEPVKSRIDDLIKEVSKKMYNCIPSAETKPDEMMIREAVQMREKEKLTEPMFRTLLKIRKIWKEEGRL